MARETKMEELLSRLSKLHQQLDEVEVLVARTQEDPSEALEEGMMWNVKWPQEDESGKKTWYAAGQARLVTGKRGDPELELRFSSLPINPRNASVMRGFLADPDARWVSIPSNKSRESRGHAENSRRPRKRNDARPQKSHIGKGPRGNRLSLCGHTANEELMAQSLEEVTCAVCKRLHAGEQQGAIVQKTKVPMNGAQPQTKLAPTFIAGRIVNAQHRELQEAKRLRDVIEHLLHQYGITDIDELIATCEALKDSVPLLSRVHDIHARVSTAWQMMGFENHPGRQQAKPQQQIELPMDEQDDDEDEEESDDEDEEANVVLPNGEDDGTPDAG